MTSEGRTPSRGPQKRLPPWAKHEEWMDGQCGCGARLIRIYSMGGSHSVCAVSGWDMDKCPDVNTPARLQS